jgi:hypothetical protein
MKTWIVETNSRRFWIDRRGWATTDETRATRYTEREARQLAHQMYGFAVNLV